MKAGWYSENLGRSYPFVRGTANGFPKDAVVDAGFLLSVAPTSGVRLHRIELFGATIRFTFTYGGAPDDLFFEVNVADAQRTVFGWSDEDEASESEAASEGPGESCEDYWSGFIVVGDLAALAAQLAGGDWEGGDGVALVEPSLTQDVSGAYVSGVTVANSDRTRSENPEGCDVLTWPFETNVDHVVRRCLTGPIRFADGYNVAVSQNAVGNEIVFNAGVGLGLGVPCNDFAHFPEEAKPDGSIFYGGGPSCHEVLRRINSVGGPRVSLGGSGGIAVTPDPSTNTLFVAVTLSDLLRCGFDESEAASEGASEGV